MLRESTGLYSGQGEGEPALRKVCRHGGWGLLKPDTCIHRDFLDHRDTTVYECMLSGMVPVYSRLKRPV